MARRPTRHPHRQWLRAPDRTAPVRRTQARQHRPAGRPGPTSTGPASTGQDSAALERRIIESGRALHRSRHDLIVALAAFDLDGRWAASGAVTCAHWTAEQLGVTVATAREWLRVGHALAALPLIAEAHARGRFSYCTIRTLTRVAVDHPHRQSDLLELIDGIPAGDIGRVLSGWCDRNEDPDERRRRQERATHLSFRVDPDGTGTMTVRMPLIDMGRLHAAIDRRVMQGTDNHRIDGRANADVVGADADAGADADVCRCR